MHVVSVFMGVSTSQVIVISDRTPWTKNIPTAACVFLSLEWSGIRGVRPGAADRRDHLLDELMLQDGNLGDDGDKQEDDNCQVCHHY